MKQIVEEWKVIEDLPNHEISNFGQCRYKKYRYLIAKTDRIYYRYMFNDHGKIRRMSVGKLVATYFVPNPNEYKLIRFKDGDPSNHIYTNIEWVKAQFVHKFSKKMIVGKDKQLSNLRKHIEFL